MKILITGFKSFNNEKINPTEILLNSLPNIYKDNEIKKILLNVEYDNDFLKIKSDIENYAPDLILMMGEAGGRNNVCLEEIAINKRHATIKDNADVLKTNEYIIKNSPLAYETKLNLDKIIKDVSNKRLAISFSAGTFICNEIYYSTLNYINSKKLNTNALFIHFPFLEGETSKRPTMSLLKMKEILFKILDSILFN